MKYQSGFANSFETEALEGALPRGQNSPQRCPYGLYAEQLSGTAFTAPKALNRRSWLYRILPTVKHMGRFAPVAHPYWLSAPADLPPDLPLGPLRWSPIPMPDAPADFVDGMRTITTAGDVPQSDWHGRSYVSDEYLDAG